MAENMAEEQFIERLLFRAKVCPSKGRLYIYESFKRELDNVDLSPEDYAQVCRQLAENLEV